MTEETVEQKPSITINDVQISVDDLPEEARGIFGRLQRLNQKKANIVLDLEEIQAGINFFSNRIVDIVNEDNAPAVNGEGEEESNTESEDSEQMCAEKETSLVEKCGYCKAQIKFWVCSHTTRVRI